MKSFLPAREAWSREKKTGRLIALAYNYPSEVRISVPNANSLKSAKK